MGVAETKNKVHGQISPKNEAIGPSLSEIADFEVPGVFRTWPKCLLKDKTFFREIKCIRVP